MFNRRARFFKELVKERCHYVLTSILERDEADEVVKNPGRSRLKNFWHLSHQVLCKDRLANSGGTRNEENAAGFS